MAAAKTGAVVASAAVEAAISGVVERVTVAHAGVWAVDMAKEGRKAEAKAAVAGVAGQASKAGHAVMAAVRELMVAVRG